MPWSFKPHYNWLLLMYGELRHLFLFHQSRHLPKKGHVAYMSHTVQGPLGGYSVIYTYMPTDQVFWLLTTLNTHRTPYTLGNELLQSVTYIHQYDHFTVTFCNILNKHLTCPSKYVKLHITKLNATHLKWFI